MAEKRDYLRFSVSQIVEHWTMALSFTVLAITGLPQKFAGDGWAEAMIGYMDGIETVRLFHHVAAIVMIVSSIYHLIIIAYKVLVLRVRWTMFPRLDDLFDAIDAIRYNLGLTKEHPKFDRFNFAEKAEYWAFVWGTVLMAVTGFIMWNPINAARWLHGDVIPVSKAAHGAEAILAVLAIVVWHFYNVHVKTLNKTVFTGKMTEQQMHEEHGLELERLKTGRPDPRPSPEVLRNRERVFIPVATLAAVVMLVMVFFLTTYEATAITTLPRRAEVRVYAPITPTPTKAPGATVQVISAKPLSATHEGRTTCLSCHAALPQPRMPADHQGRADNTCTACHKIGSAPVPTGSAQMGTTPIPASSTGGAPKVQPANHAGRTTCMACHESLPQPKLPADHKGRTDATCAACHPLGTGAAPGSSTPAAGGLAPSAVAKAQPVNHAGRPGCLVCHGVLPQPKLPADHQGRTDATCVACHKAP
ncbi:MAG: cytochrome b/b6 domain-containing protein [Chloroflexi bacterium]|nr:cytochrome b/b6 domain-containing protein [Chloroflexota bacterium]